MPRMITPGATIRIAVAFCIAAVLAACKGDGPPVPTTFAPTGGSTIAMTGVVASSVTTVPQVQILDAKGKGIKGLRVRWKVGTNSGHVTNDSTLTDNSGTASSGGWTYGTAAGLQTLSASADGVSTVTFTAQVAPGPPTNLVRVSPDGQTATVNTPVASPPSVRAQDAFGNPVPSVVVTFAVTSGGGTLANAQVTSGGDGIATSGTWTLGTQSGTQSVAATATNVTATSVSATALPGAPVGFLKMSGDNQVSATGYSVLVPPGVRVVDAFNNGIGVAPVTFTPGAGSGTVTGGTLTTDATTGIATVGSWTLGSAAVQTLTATSSMLPGKAAVFTATRDSVFDIDVRFIGTGGTAQIRQAFLDAAAKWRRMIVGNLRYLNVVRPAGDCLSFVPAVNERINDIVIFARIGPIDGVNNILAQAGPCLYSTVDYLPITGVMEFDEADITNMLNNGTFNDVVLHEMGHVLGIGTMWNEGRTLLSNEGGVAPFFTGTAARAAFAAINTVTFGGNPVPVEGNAAPVGTRDGHWRESVFGRELMQGYAKIGGMPLSRVTVASLQDLGYVVNLANADPFTITSPILAGFPQSNIVSVRLGDDQPSTPMLGVDPRGQVVKITPRRKN